MYTGEGVEVRLHTTVTHLVWSLCYWLGITLSCKVSAIGQSAWYQQCCMTSYYVHRYMFLHTRTHTYTPPLACDSLHVSDIPWQDSNACCMLSFLQLAEWCMEPPPSAGDQSLPGQHQAPQWRPADARHCCPPAGRGATGLCSHVPPRWRR